MAEGNISIVANGILRLLDSSELMHKKDTAPADEFLYLKEVILTIQDVFLTEKEHTEKDEYTETFLGRLENVFYDTDNLLDEIFTVILRRRNMSRAEKVRSFFSTSSNPLVFQRKMGYEIKRVTKAITEIANETSHFRARYQFLRKNFRRNSRHPISREAYPVVPEGEVIGRDVDKTEILKLVLQSEEKKNVRVISILGVQGVGKTTLARLVINDHDVVQQNFELRMWIFVGDPFDERLIVQRLIKAATGVFVPPSNSLQMDQLHEQLRKIINRKRCLLVLDDMVDVNHDNWLGLRNLLMDCAKGSTVLVTTRSEKVAKITSTVQPYCLDRLTEADSWDVFNTVFGEIKLRQTKRSRIKREISRQSAREFLFTYV